MANAWARVTGNPGVSLGTVGPGATDLVPGGLPPSQTAPVVVLTAQTQSFRTYPSHGSTQESNQLGLFAPITKWNAYVGCWERIPEVFRTAFRVALSGRPGPVHVNLPADVLFKKGEVEPDAFFKPYRYRAVRGAGGNPEPLWHAATLLLEAKKPLIHSGCGPLRALAWKELLELAEQIGAAVSLTVGARGVVPDDHPQAFKSAGYGAIAAQNVADVVLAVGTRFGELDGWGRAPFWAEVERQKLIQIDLAPEMLDLNRPIDIGIVGDAKVALGQLLDIIKQRSGPKEHGDWVRECKETEES